MYKYVLQVVVIQLAGFLRVSGVQSVWTGKKGKLTANVVLWCGWRGDHTMQPKAWNRPSEGSALVWDSLIGLDL